MSETNTRPVQCSKCGENLRTDYVRTVNWYGDEMVLIENIPAWICDNCGEQYYDEEITEALFRLKEEGFSGAEKVREITVPVYRIKRRPLPKDEEKVWPEFAREEPSLDES
jgi:YgiT-type zinc finger domain-containing protein